jgi:cholesterol 7-desaturase
MYGLDILLSFIPQCSNCYFNTSQLIVALILTVGYYLYYRKYRYYLFLQKDEIKNAKVPRGKCPPFFPNGWYRLLTSVELEKNQVKYIGYCGRDIVIFRGTNGKVYALQVNF